MIQLVKPKRFKNGKNGLSAEALERIKAGGENWVCGVKTCGCLVHTEPADIELPR